VNQHKFCYVLTTTCCDLFADMTYASAAFLRFAYPEVEIICLCDAQSHRALEVARHPLLELVDRAEPIQTPDGPPGYRNRFVKTQMRQILQGDFVYFDSDTLMVDRIDEMLTCAAPIAAVANHSGTGHPAEIPVEERAIFEMMGWALPHRSYINGGVLLLRDCEPTHRFACEWHEKWLAWSRRGKHTDQQSLNSALADSGVQYKLLGNRFNGQVTQRPSVGLEPVAVWHFYFAQSDATDFDFPRTILDEAIARFRSSGRLTPEVIRELRGWPYPWRTPTILDRWFVRSRVLRRDTLPWNSASRCWLAGYRRKAVMQYLDGQFRLLKQRWDKRTRRQIVKPQAINQDSG
jgi:hypothetical protein